MKITVEDILSSAGTGRFQKRLLGIFGLVWAADAMQVISTGFAARSISTTFGLSSSIALQTGTAFFFGMFIGASLFGALADRYGRRKILLLTVTADVIFGLLSAFAHEFWILLLFRFFTGAAVGGTLPVDYAMMAEFLPSQKRGRWLVFLEGFWAVGTIMVSLVAWLADLFEAQEAWRWIFAINALPALIGLAFRFQIPESSLHLIRKNRWHEARQVFNKVLKTNGQPVLSEQYEIVWTKTVVKESLFSVTLKRRTILILLIWFLVSISYYGIFTWLPPQLIGEGFGFLRGYGFLVVTAFAQVPGYALAAYGVEAWGRRPTLIVFLLLSATGCGLFTIFSTPFMISVSILLMSFALLGTWGALYAFTPELYPTSVRATGMGASGAAARLGGILAPSVLSFLFVQSFSGTIALFAFFLVIATIAAFMIDIETKAQALT